MKKGFTLIELMIVVAIIAIIAAIAIPSLMQSRIQANETNAVAALKQYANAQSIYKKGNYAQAVAGNNGGGGLTREFAQQLVYLRSDTNAKGETYNLLPLVFGNASKKAATPAAYQGYLFDEPADSPTMVWTDSFGQHAGPSSYNKSGVNSFYINEDAVVFQKDIADGVLSATKANATNYQTQAEVTAETPPWIVP